MASKTRPAYWLLVQMAAEELGNFDPAEAAKFQKMAAGLDKSAPAVVISFQMAPAAADTACLMVVGIALLEDFGIARRAAATADYTAVSFVPE